MDLPSFWIAHPKTEGQAVEIAVTNLKYFGTLVDSIAPNYYRP